MNHLGNEKMNLQCLFFITSTAMWAALFFIITSPVMTELLKREIVSKCDVFISAAGCLALSALGFWLFISHFILKKP